MRQRVVKITSKSWPVAGEFRIARSSLTVIRTVIVEIFEGPHRGRGECRPYPRYDETQESVTDQIQSVLPQIEDGLSCDDLQDFLPPGAARNALDCALWDLEAQKKGCSVSTLLDLPPPTRRQTAYTLSMDTPDKMAKAAQAAKAYPILKIKIGGADAVACSQAVINARPDASLIIDANEALDPKSLAAFMTELNDPHIVMIEQPLPKRDALNLPDLSGFLPKLCADESAHTRSDLDDLWAAGYRAVNVKLDKAGGLTESLGIMRQAKDMGFDVMAGCMVASSLGMAPMMYLESLADVIDLDGPLLLDDDIENGLLYEGPWINPPKQGFWGA